MEGVSSLDLLRSVREKQSLATQFMETRARSETITRRFSAEDCQIQSMPDASPLKWHLAHTTWFWETFLLLPNVAGYKPHNAEFSFLFNSYYNAVGERHARNARGMITRPSLDDVYAYRAAVDSAVTSFLRSDASKASSDVEAIARLGMAHEEQHQELMLTDIKHALFQNPLMPAAFTTEPAPPAKERAIGWRKFSGGLTEVGNSGSAFHFDNEGPHHRVWLEPFELSDRLVTNADVLAFIEAGGYSSPSLWLSDGWSRVQSENLAHPFYWFKQDDEWWSFTLAGARKIEPHAPCLHLSFYEANAIADWLGGRLPTEFEWEMAIGSVVEPNDVDKEPSPIKTEPQGGSEAPFDDAFGVAWQWTRSAYSPYPGYKPPKGAVGEYNGKFMSSQFVLRGSSFATRSGHSRPTYRNFFYPKDRWQFTGLRLAKDA